MRVQAHRRNITRESPTSFLQQSYLLRWLESIPLRRLPCQRHLGHEQGHIGSVSRRRIERATEQLVVWSACATPILLRVHLRLWRQYVPLVELLLIPVASIRTLLKNEIDPVSGWHILRFHILLNRWLIRDAIRCLWFLSQILHVQGHRRQFL